MCVFFVLSHRVNHPFLEGPFALNFDQDPGLGAVGPMNSLES